MENGHVGAILSRNQFLRAKTFASNMVALDIFEGCQKNRSLSGSGEGKKIYRFARNDFRAKKYFSV